MICHLKVIVHLYQHKKKQKKKTKHTRNFSRYVKFFKTDEEFIFNIAQPWPTLS